MSGAASDSIWRLVTGLPGASRAGKVLAMMQLYVDDSSIGQPPVYCLAGYLASVEVWASFSDEWAAFLAEPPSLAYWKTSHAMDFRGQYTYWSREERDKKLNKAIDIVNRHKPFYVSVTVCESDYKRHLGDLQETGIRSWQPYVYLFYRFIHSIANYAAEKGLPRPIDLIFDDQPEHMKYVLSVWGDYQEGSLRHFKDIIGVAPIFRDEKTFLPIQAADLVAWYIRRSFSNKINGKGPVPITWERSEDYPIGVNHHEIPMSLINSRLCGLYEHLIENGIWSDFTNRRDDLNVYFRHSGEG